MKTVFEFWVELAVAGSVVEVCMMQEGLDYEDALSMLETRLDVSRAVGVGYFAYTVKGVE